MDANAIHRNRNLTWCFSGWPKQINAINWRESGITSYREYFDLYPHTIVNCSRSICQKLANNIIGSLDIDHTIWRSDNQIKISQQISTISNAPSKLKKFAIEGILQSYGLNAMLTVTKKITFKEPTKNCIRNQTAGNSWTKQYITHGAIYVATSKHGLNLDVRDDYMPPYHGP